MVIVIRLRSILLLYLHYIPNKQLINNFRYIKKLYNYEIIIIKIDLWI